VTSAGDREQFADRFGGGGELIFGRGRPAELDQRIFGRKTPDCLKPLPGRTLPIGCGDKPLPTISLGLFPGGPPGQVPVLGVG
jgi:hypothetical protein